MTKIGRNIYFDDVPADYEEVSVKVETHCLLHVLIKRSKSTIMWQNNVIKSKTKSQIFKLSRNKNLQIRQIMLRALLAGFL